MNKFLKYGLVAAGGAGLLLAGGAAYIAATFNPNDYKPQIIKAVKESKHRTLKLDGDIKLAFFPSIGAEIGKLSLSERESEKEFAAMDSARISLALLPLLSRQAVVNEVKVSGLKVALVKFKNGKSNIDDLLGQDQSKTESSSTPPVTLDIASVQVENAELRYRDERSGAQYELKKLDLKTGRIASGVPARVEGSVLVQANQPKVDITAQLKAMLTFDPDKQMFAVEGLDLQAKGAALDMSGLSVQARGDVAANLAAGEYSAHKLAVEASGAKGKDNFEAKLDAPALKLAKDKLSGDKITLNAKLDGASGNIAANLIVPGLEGNAQFFKSGAIALDVDVKQPEQSFKVKLSSPVAGNLEGKQFNLSDLRIAVNATGDKLPNKAISSEMKGSVQIDAGRDSVAASLAGGLLQSQVRIKVAVNNFDSPAIRFDADVDQFDADLYLPKKQAGAEGGAKAAPSKEEPFDLSGLKKLNLEGSLRIGKLKVANVKSSQIRLDVKARNGVLALNPLSANLYQGSMGGSITVDASRATPDFSVNEKLSGISIGPLLKDAAGFDMLEGRGSVMLNVHTQGSTVGALKKALGGSAAVNLADGAVKGINVAKTLRGAGSLFGKQAQTQGANTEEKTDFSELKASFKIANGVAHNDDLSLKSPLLRLAGNGDINIGNDSINYLAKATVVGSLQGQGGMDNLKGITVPVRLSGPFTDLKYTLDFGAMVGGVVKEKMQTEIKTRMQDQLKEGLKGLFR